MSFVSWTHVGRKHVLHGVHVGATCRVQLNHPRAAVMWPFWQITLTRCYCVSTSHSYAAMLPFVGLSNGIVLKLPSQSSNNQSYMADFSLTLSPPTGPSKRTWGQVKMCSFQLLNSSCGETSIWHVRSAGTAIQQTLFNQWLQIENFCLYHVDSIALMPDMLAFTTFLVLITWMQ